MDLVELSKLLTDRPVWNKNEFINRNEELSFLNNLVEKYKGSILGVAGERGVGKTSFFNVWEHDKIIARIMNRENPYTILSDLCLVLADKLGKKYENIVKEIGVDLRASIGINPSIDIGLIEKAPAFRKAVFTLKKYLDKEGDVVIILDEIDKERKEELIKIVDAIKYAFESTNTTLIVALPPVIHSEYLLGKASLIDTPNLENIFAYMFELQPLSPSTLISIVEQRARSLIDLIDEEALVMAVEYASGNPRQVLSVLREATLFATSKITKKDVEGVIRKYLRVFLGHLNLSEKEKMLLINYVEHWDEFIKRINKLGVFKNKTAIYTYIQRLEKKSIMKRDGKKLLLHPKIKIAFQMRMI